MKPPLKPFTVEVKRSRSNPSGTRPISSEPPVFDEARAAPAPVPPSKARQLAEQMFASLTASSRAAPETMVTAQSVSRTMAPLTATVEEPPTVTGVAGPAIRFLPVDEAVQPKPLKPRAGKVRTSHPPTSKVVKSKAQAAVKLAEPNTLVRPQRNALLKISEVKSSEMKMAQVSPVAPAAQAQLQGRQNWGWRPGERWKRRLRHLR